MPVRKISVSLDEAVLERATSVAEAQGVSLSTWLSRAVERHENFSGMRQSFSVMAPRELQWVVLVGGRVMVMCENGAAASWLGRRIGQTGWSSSMSE